MQPVIQAGPRGASLEAFLAALDRLEAAIDFLQAHRSLQSAEDALRHTTALRDSGLVAAGGEFGAVLQKAAAPVPQALLARARAAAGGDGGALPPDAPLELLPGWALARLRQLAEAMLRGGGTPASRACMRQYAEARRGVLLAALEGFLAPFAGGGSSREEAARATWQQMEGRIPG